MQYDATVQVPKQRIQHRCGRFLAELRGGIVYVMCVRCKDLVAIPFEQPSQEVKVKTTPFR